ncbi:MAG: Gfo/Idh/MocA family oxidoreductase [Oscillatoriaceae bacterium SKW80]|nr:Gfo/Idh/MocA family oxidoreductase [Oscillatoriaceae bacterium SKYG93]MCX8122174.1 Gfo/Idh/MocA family oxidoreductase [Oscillatoriaceae bacterium SKW80]MDW8454461.1 Gfo/Idh/MocA family oxidoreductase [Oscillatoriaceae cyanobacterium SKYGB_i_bin93]HIK29325.1 Gfo/Idh/MocA family oxidoreductase [Oscillatoriaceae cyanobacterium M7585_C2015_266]
MVDRNSRIGIAIVGVGRWGVHLLRNFLNHPQARVVAVADRNPRRLQLVKQQFKLDTHAIAMGNWGLVRQLPGIEAVVIATPASTHYALIADALQLGYHVLAEKPLTLAPEQALELCQLAEKQQKQLVVDHTYLFHPAIAVGKEAIRARRLGDLRYGYAARTHQGPIRQDADVLWDLAAHDICIFNTWQAQLPIQVQARGTVWLNSKRRGVVRGGGKEKEIYPFFDLMWVTLTYASGFQAVIHLCWLNPDKQRRICVNGSRGTLIFDEMRAAAPLILKLGGAASEEVLAIAPEEPLARVCSHFLTCVARNERSPISSGWVGFELVKILAACSQSALLNGIPISL